MSYYKEHKNLVKKFGISEEELKAVIENIDFTKFSDSIAINLVIQDLLYRGDIAKDDKF